MEFEVVDNRGGEPRHTLDELGILLRDRRGYVRGRVDKVPFWPALLVSALVALELTLLKRLWGGLSTGPRALLDFVFIWGGFAAAAGVFTSLVATGAEYFNRHGRPGVLFAHLMAGLMPLLLVLPMAAVVWIGNMPWGLGLLVFLLAIKTLANWRDAAEDVYGLTRMQSLGIALGAELIASLTAALLLYGWMVYRVSGALRALSGG